jgi:hypothetical protein
MQNDDSADAYNGASPHLYVRDATGGDGVQSKVLEIVLKCMIGAVYSVVLALLLKLVIYCVQFLGSQL